MSVIINPGSTIDSMGGDGWTNTVEQARKHAKEWLRRMRREDQIDAKLLPGETFEDGRWTFKFQHNLTGVVCDLCTHGIDNDDAYRKENIFTPRMYWNGSSCSNPMQEDFLKDGYRVEIRIVEATP